MNAYEQLAVLTAMEKAVKERIKEVRTEANAEMRSAYESMGVEKMALKVGGKKVGEFTMVGAGEKIAIEDRAAFEEFALDYGMATAKRTIDPRMMESAIKALESVFEPDVIEQAVIEEVILDADWEKAIVNVGGLPCYMDSNMPIPGLRFEAKAPTTRLTGCKPEIVLPIVNELPYGFNGYLLDGEVA